MKLLTRFLVVLLSFSIVFSSTVTYAANKQSNTKTVTVELAQKDKGEEGPQKYLIKVKDKKKKDKIVDELKKRNGKKIKNINSVNTFVAEINKDELENLKKQGDIEFEKDSKLQAFEEKTKEEVTPSNIEQVKAPEVHIQGNTGQKVKVAVFDTGISEHEDLKIQGGTSFIEGTNYASDENGHGTHVSGIIASLKNEKGLVGIAPAVELYSVKVLNKDGSGSYSSIIQGIEWAINNKINIINMSLGGFEYSALLEEAINLAYENNILIVSSAGNTGDEMTYPAKYENVISVGAVDKDNNRTTFSSIGTELDVVAPGQDIYSTIPNNSYGSKSGTSMAAPHVAGVLSLIWSKDLSVPNEVIKGLLNYSSLGLGDNFYYGNGLVDATKALDMFDAYVYSKKNKKKKKKKYISDNKAPVKDAEPDGQVNANGTTEAYYLESAHPYADNYSNTWSISKAGATNIRVHFSRIDTEANYDKVTTSAGDSWSGAYTDTWSNWSGTSNINLTLTTDGSVTKDGFYVDRIEYTIPATSGGANVESYNLESPHPYPDNYSNSWTISKTGATNIRVHFSSIDTETNFDYVRTSAGDSWTGTYNDTWSSWSGSSSINVSLSSDGSLTKNGFYIDRIEYVIPSTVGGGVEYYSLESPHPYSDNYSNSWTISKTGATNVRVHFSSIDTETNFDYVRTSAGDSWSGYYNDVWSSWSGSSSINVSLSTDSSVTKNGFYIDKIEYMMSPGSLEPYETAVDAYWPSEDTPYPTVPRIGYLSGHINPPSYLTMYDDTIFDDVDLVNYSTTTSGDLSFPDNTDISLYPQIPYEDAGTPDDATATGFGTNTLTYNGISTLDNNNPDVNAEFIPLLPIVASVGIRLVVRQYLKNSFKTIVVRNGHLAGKLHPKTGIKFSNSGFPKFDSKFQVNLSSKYLKSANKTQFNQANTQLRIAVNNGSKYRSKFDSSQLKDINNGKTPNGYVWHHHEKTGKLQLVNRYIHDKTGHTGGKAIWGSN